MDDSLPEVQEVPEPTKVIEVEKAELIFMLDMEKGRRSFSVHKLDETNLPSISKHMEQEQNLAITLVTFDIVFKKILKF